MAGLKQMCFHKSVSEKKRVILRWGGTRDGSCEFCSGTENEMSYQGLPKAMASLHTVKNTDHHCISTSSAGHSIETCHQMPLLKLYINAQTIRLLVLANIQQAFSTSGM